MQKRDYLIRLIERVAEAIAAILAHLSKDEIERARHTADEALRLATRVDRNTFDKLDAATLAPLLGPPEAVRAIARLTATAADVERAAGRMDEAARRTRRAAELYRVVGPGDDPADHACIAALGKALAKHAKP